MHNYPLPACAAPPAPPPSPPSSARSVLFQATAPHFRDACVCVSLDYSTAHRRRGRRQSAHTISMQIAGAGFNCIFCVWAVARSVYAAMYAAMLLRTKSDRARQAGRQPLRTMSRVEASAAHRAPRRKLCFNARYARMHRASSHAMRAICACASGHLISRAASQPASSTSRVVLYVHIFFCVLRPMPPRRCTGTGNLCTIERMRERILPHTARAAHAHFGKLHLTHATEDDDGDVRRATFALSLFAHTLVRIWLNRDFARSVCARVCVCGLRRRFFSIASAVVVVVVRD